MPQTNSTANKTSRAPRIMQWAAAGFGALTAGFGLTALAGWLIGLPLLTTFGAGNIPMAPNTALFFLLTGGAVAGILSRGALSARLILAGRVPAILFILTSLALFILSAHGIHPEAEHLGMHIRGAAAGAPLGHMSPVTALCFTLAALALLAALHTTERKTTYGVLAAAAAMLLGHISFVLVLAYGLGAPLLYDSGTIPPALNTSLAFLSLATALASATLLRLWPHGSMRALAAGRALIALVAVFVLLVAGIVTIGLLVFRKHEKEFRTAASQELLSVTALKVKVLEQYRLERHHDAALFHENAVFAEQVEDYLAHPESGRSREALLAWLRVLGRTQQYDRLRFYDIAGVQRLSIPENLPPASKVIRLNVSAAMRQGGIVIHDLYLNDLDRRPYQSVLTPIKNKSGRVIGLLTLRSDPASFLYPFLEQWPSPSKSAETVLLRREGGDALFLSNIRFREKTALIFRIPLTKTDSLAVQAVLGREGIFSGIDCRDVPVLAALKRVPDSPWFLVARVDTAELLAPLRERLWVMVFVLTMLLVVSGAGVGYVWRRERHAQQIERLKKEAEQDRLRSAELETAVARRTAQLNAANKEMEAFSYSVAHDLKAPLRGIDGYSRLLEEDHGKKLDEEGRILIGNIKKGVAQMFQLIEDILAYSRMERRILHKQRVDLKSLFGDILAEYGRQLEELHASTRVEIPAIEVDADYDGLAIVLRNLLDNAIKFSSKDGAQPALDIGALLEEKKAVIWIKDNGIGFDMQYHDRIFEIFNRLERSVDYPGTGVGLALVRRAMERMGGRVWAESAPGRGATFFLALPMNGAKKGSASKPALPRSRKGE